MKEAALDIPGASFTNKGAPEGGFILVVEGIEATGKSRLAGTGPGPIYYASFNSGADRVVPDLREAGKTIALGSFEFDYPKFVTRKDADWWNEKGEKVMAETYQPFLDAWAAARRSAARTLVVDRADEVWDVAQLANFGKRQQNNSLSYGPVTDEYLGPFRAAKRDGKLVVLIHSLGEEWQTVQELGGNGQVVEKRKTTGRMKREGHKQIGGLADAIVRLHFMEAGSERVQDPKTKKWSMVETPARFETEIVLAKQNMTLNGERFETVGLETLMTMLKPSVDADVWAD